MDFRHLILNELDHCCVNNFDSFINHHIPKVFSTNGGFINEFIIQKDLLNVILINKFPICAIIEVERRILGSFPSDRVQR
jgi:hypothetical protein